MKDLTIQEFLGSGFQQIADVLQSATADDEIYRITGDSGSFIIMSETEYNVHRDALRMLLQGTEGEPSGTA